jgi:cyclic pyranopterin phosphate synthase
MKNTNEDELVDFIALTEKLPIHIRFIEFMPFEGNHWSHDKVVNYHKMLKSIGGKFEFEKLTDLPHSTSKKYKVPGYKGTFAFITTMSTPFCGDCNRLRLTADGKMKNCLFSKTEIDLLNAYRQNNDLDLLIRECVFDKKYALGGQTDPDHFENRSMILIGG